MRYKVPVTITISFDAFIEAGSPDGALTNLTTILELNGDEFENTEGLLFEEDSGIEIENSVLAAAPSFGAVEEAPDTATEGDGDEAQEDGDEKDDPTAESDATPPTPRDLK